MFAITLNAWYQAQVKYLALIYWPWFIWNRGMESIISGNVNYLFVSLETWGLSRLTMNWLCIHLFEKIYIKSFESFEGSFTGLDIWKLDISLSIWLLTVLKLRTQIFETFLIFRQWFNKMLHTLQFYMKRW